MNAFLIAWRASRILPMPVVRAAAAAFGWWAWATRAKPARRLEDNLRRVTGIEGRPLRSLTRRGMASASRYYAETLELPRMTPEVIDARVRMVDAEWALTSIKEQGRFVVVLGHSGNWDLVGAYTCRNIGRVTSVAEVLEPRVVFDEFVRVREAVGMQILGHEGSTTFRKLVRIGKVEGGVLALVADRDLSGDGVAVTFAGHPAKVAPGPAALSIAVGCPLMPVTVYYERLRGERRRAAKSRWGTVMEFGPIIEASTGTSAERVVEATQQWVDFIANQVRAHPEDWHMLQRFGWVD